MILLFAESSFRYETIKLIATLLNFVQKISDLQPSLDILYQSLKTEAAKATSRLAVQTLNKDVINLNTIIINLWSNK